MNTDVLTERVIAQKEKISPVVIGATLIVISLFVLGLLYQLLTLTGVS